MLDIISDIEKNYDVAKIRAGRFQVWPFLRWAYFSSYLMTYDSDNPQHFSFWDKFSLLKNVYYGVHNIFRRYDFIIHSNTSELKYIEGKYHNKLTDQIYRDLSGSTILYIEEPLPFHYPKKQIAYPAIVSGTLLKLIKKCLHVMYLRKIPVYHSELLDTINSKFGLDIDYHGIINSFFRDYHLFSTFFRIMRPKAIFTTGHDHHGIKAANDMGITTVEIQHGAIGEHHPAYHSSINLDTSFYPCNILVFGNYDKQCLEKSPLFRDSKIYPVGSFYTDYEYKTKLKLETIEQKKKNYRRSVGVTLQWTVEDRVIQFIINAARKNDRILYVLIPRPKDNTDFSKYTLPDNVLVYEDHDFYRTIKHLDFHSTVNSTCALEAPSLGIQNILIDIDGQARKYYKNILSNANITKFINTQEEYVSTILNFDKQDPDIVRKGNSDVIATNYQGNIHHFLKSVCLL